MAIKLGSLIKFTHYALEENGGESKWPSTWNF